MTAKGNCSCLVIIVVAYVSSMVIAAVAFVRPVVATVYRGRRMLSMGAMMMAIMIIVITFKWIIWLEIFDVEIIMMMVAPCHIMICQTIKNSLCYNKNTIVVISIDVV